MEYIINEMDKLSAEEISRWQYEKPYSIYSMDGSEEGIKELMKGSYYSVYENDELIGYFCFGESAQVPIGSKFGAYDDEKYIDVGLGLRPELCGKGQGYKFLRYGLSYAIDTFSENRFRLTVADFNVRAIKAYKKVGFEYNDIRFIKKSEKGSIEFIIMILEDWVDIR